MKYMLLIYGNEEAFSSVGAEGDHQGGPVTGGTPMVTDGPYAETKEYLGSLTSVDCDSLERALEIAARNPAAQDRSPSRGLTDERG